MPSAAAVPPAPATKGEIAETYGKIPLEFESNRGQADKRVKFVARGQGYGLYLTGQEAVLALHGSPSSPRGVVPATGGKTDILRMQLSGANPGVQPSGIDPLPGKANYFTGSDPTHWETGIPTYGKVRFFGVYPGVDLIYCGN